MEYWNTLVGNALMGTERQPPQPPGAAVTEDPLTKILSQLSWQKPERSILSAAGVITLYQQAEQPPKTTDCEASVPCVEETFAYCSPQTARHLDTVLTEHTAILPECLRLMAQAQQCVPPELLPK
ncbi:MAG: hypothetical protein F6K65_43960, partial [Moorea sp. SIO3C2]|nr:hypothetical protein [Moorena sp. SIO3C2]